MSSFCLLNNEQTSCYAITTDNVKVTTSPRITFVLDLDAKPSLTITNDDDDDDAGDDSEQVQLERKRR